MPKPLGKRLVALGVVLTISVTGCGMGGKDSSTSTKRQKSSASDNKEFSNYIQKSFKESLESNSIFLHYKLKHPEKYGIKKGRNSLVDDQLEGATDSEDEAKKGLKEINQFDYEKLSKSQQETYDVIKDYLQDKAKISKYPYYQNIFSSTSGVQSQLPITLGEYRLESEKDVDKYFSVLESVDKYLETCYAYAKKQVKKGTFPSDTTIDKAVSQIDAIVKEGNKCTLIGTFRDRINEMKSLSESKRQQLIAENETLVMEHVLPAFDKLGKQIANLKGNGVNDGGIAGLKNGKAYYEALVKQETGSSKSVDEMIKMAETNVRRGIIETRSIFDRSPKAAKQFSDGSLQTYTGSQPRKMLANLEKYIKKNYPKAPKVNYKIKYVQESMEDNTSPAFYMVPAMDDYKNNVIYVNRKKSKSDDGIYATLAHEGYPGHLYQNTYYLSTKQHPIRHILEYAGYSEGWATYVEADSYRFIDAGQMSADLAELYIYRLEINLALSARIDLGVNYEGWSKKETRKYIEPYMSNRESQDALYDQVVNNPANYLSYYVGYKEFNELKAYYKKEAGKEYKIENFHKIVLDAGPCSFDILKRRIDDNLR